MFDLHRVIQRAATASRYDLPLLAAPFDLAPGLVEDALRRGQFGGVIEARPPASLVAAEAAAGWWVDRHSGLWRLNRGVSREIVLIGCSESQRIGGQMLLEAQLGGILRIDLIGITGDLLRTVDVRAEIVARLNSGGPVGDEISYRAAYAELLEAFGDSLRLDPSELRPGKVVMLIGSLGPGGAERQLAYTAAGIARDHGREVEVGCSYLDPPGDFFSHVITGAGGCVSQVPPLVESFSSPRMMQIREHFAREYASLGFSNIVHTVYHYACFLRDTCPSLVHTWMDYCNVLGGLAAQIVGIPSVVLAGRSVGPEHFPALFQPYMRPGYDMLFRRGKPLFLNNSHAGADDYRRWLDLRSSDFRIVHNGSDFPDRAPGFARERVRAALGFEPSAFVVGAVTRFSEEKDPRLMLETFKILHDQFPTMRFVAYGAGLLLEDMRSYAATLGLNSALSLPGITDDVWSSLDAMDCFILTSRMEGLANVLIEAQAAGLPVVCTGVGGMPETYREGETGFGATSRNPQALADIVAGLAADPGKRDRMSRQARTFVRDQFSVDAMVANVVESYELASPDRLPLRSNHLTSAIQVGTK